MTDTHPWQPAHVCQVPAVFGPLHGKQVWLGDWADRHYHIEPPVLGRIPLVGVFVYHARQVVWILPGRTDRQQFTVLVAEHPDDSQTKWAVSDALLAAWVDGWVPQPETYATRREMLDMQSDPPPDRRDTRWSTRLWAGVAAAARRAVRPRRGVGGA